MAEGMTIMSLIISIIAGLVPIGVIITIVVLAIKGIKGHGGKISDGDNSAETQNDNKKVTTEEIREKLNNMFADMTEKKAMEEKQKQEAKREVKERRCKNCGATLAEDKNGKLHCPYCQSKYF